MTTNRITLEAGRRTTLSKGERNSIRKRGDLPGIVYGKNMEPQAIYITGESFKQLRGHGRLLVDLNIEGTNRVSAMINEIDRDMIKRDPIHIDFHAVDLSQPINVEVQIILDGLEAVEKRRGVIQQQTREVEVRCLPTAVPEYILHNISSLEIGQTATLADIALPAGVTLSPAQDITTVICSVIEAKNAAPDTEPPAKEPALVDAREGRE